LKSSSRERENAEKLQERVATGFQRKKEDEFPTLFFQLLGTWSEKGVDVILQGFMLGLHD
jgi:hypothetical protein